MNKKQEIFAIEYMKTLNATQAAKAAGYTDKWAHSQGQRLTKNDEIKAYIKDKMNMNQKIMKAEEILETLSSIARGESKEPAFILVGSGRQEEIQVAPNTKDRIKAMELLAKRYGLFDEVVSLNVDIIEKKNAVKQVLDQMRKE